MTEPLFLMSDEFSEHFWRLVIDFVLLCQIRVHFVLKFVQLLVKIVARDLSMFVLKFVARCQ